MPTRSPKTTDAPRLLPPASRSRLLSPHGWEHINLTGDYVWRSSAKIGACTLTQLRFAVINLREDLHLQECAHAGRTKCSPTHEERGWGCKVGRTESRRC